jgi:hypothetical protein
MRMVWVVINVGEVILVNGLGAILSVEAGIAPRVPFVGRMYPD